MIQSEKLININPNQVVLESSVYGTYTFRVYQAGVYDVILVGAGGLTTGVYSGDSATGNWRGMQISRGGQGGYVHFKTQLVGGDYSATVGALGGGTDRFTGSYRGAKDAPAMGSLNMQTSLIFNAVTLAIAYGGGRASTAYSGNQKNDGARYVYTNDAAGGSYIVSSTVSENPFYTFIEGWDGAAGVHQSSNGNMSYTTTGSYQNYGRPNEINSWYYEAYSIGYNTYNGTDGYIKVTYIGMV